MKRALGGLKKNNLARKNSPAPAELPVWNHSSSLAKVKIRFSPLRQGGEERRGSEHLLAKMEIILFQFSVKWCDVKSFKIFSKKTKIDLMTIFHTLI